MSKILSEEEVNALLRTVPEQGSSPDPASDKGETPADSTGDSASTDALAKAYKPVQTDKHVSVYSFRRPDRVPKPLLRSLHLLHDKFCSNLSSGLSAYLRAVTEVSLLSVEQTTYAEFLLSLSDPTCFSAISMKPLTGVAALEVNLDLVFPLLDRLLGGSGNLPKMTRSITEIEKNIMQGVIKLVTSNLTEAWRPVTPIEFGLHSTETRPQLLQVASANEVVILVIFEVKLGETRGIMHLCLPFSSLEPISNKFEMEIDVRRHRNLNQDFSRLARIISAAPVLVSAELSGGRIPIHELLSIKVGDVIRLERRLTDKIQIHTSGVPRFDGIGVLVDKRKAVQVVGVLEANDAS
ncbi:MAG: flagellar motor switch protein FliM [Acidobacteriota bacterium]